MKKRCLVGWFIQGTIHLERKTLLMRQPCHHILKSGNMKDVTTGKRTNAQSFFNFQLNLLVWFESLRRCALERVENNATQHGSAHNPLVKDKRWRFSAGRGLCSHGALFFLQTAVRGHRCCCFPFLNSAHILCRGQVDAAARQSSPCTLLFLSSHVSAKCAECRFAWSCWKRHGCHWKRHHPEAAGLDDPVPKRINKKI